MEHIRNGNHTKACKSAERRAEQMIQRMGLGVVGALFLGSGLMALSPYPGESTREIVTIWHSQGGYLGVSIRNIQKGDLETLSLQEEGGVYIEEVEGESPAEAAGLQESDVVLEYAGERVRSVRQFKRLVLETPPGREAPMKVWRNGSTVQLTAQLGDQFSWLGARREIHVQKDLLPEFEPDIHAFRFDGDPLPLRHGRLRLGVQVVPLTSQMAEFLGISGKEGVLILEALPSTPAEAAGLQAGDVILSVNGKPVNGPEDLIRLISKGENEVAIVRKKELKTISVNLPGEASTQENVIEM